MFLTPINIKYLIGQFPYFIEIFQLVPLKCFLYLVIVHVWSILYLDFMWICSYGLTLFFLLIFIHLVSRGSVLVDFWYHTTHCIWKNYRDHGEFWIILPSSSRKHSFFSLFSFFFSSHTAWQEVFIEVVCPHAVRGWTGVKLGFCVCKSCSISSLPFKCIPSWKPVVFQGSLLNPSSFMGSSASLCG